MYTYDENDQLQALLQYKAAKPVAQMKRNTTCMYCNFHTSHPQTIEPLDNRRWHNYTESKNGDNKEHTKRVHPSILENLVLPNKG
jgi:hypothetical protein